MSARLPTGRVTPRLNWKDIVDAGGEAFTGEDEPIEDAGVLEIYLPSLHAFIETDFRLNTQEDGLGTDLTIAVDYELAEINTKLTTEYGVSVYEKIKILNVTYQTGFIYAFGKYSGDVNFAEYFNTIQSQLDELYSGTNQKDLGHLDYYSTYKEREGLKPAALDNAISQGSYPAYFAEIGHLWNAAHVAAGDADLSASGSLFYPTPPPGFVTRSGIPDSAAIDATLDINDATDQIHLPVAIDHSQLKIFKAINGDGVPIRLKLISGALPGGIADEETIYYIRFKTSPTIELYDTEANAIDTSGTTGRLNLVDAVGTFNLTQQGIVYDDAGQGHWHKILGTAVGGVATIGDVGSKSVDPGVVYTDQVTDAIADDKGNGTPRVTNETHGREQIMFAYFKVEFVQVVIGDPVSALRDDQGWVEFTGNWTNTEFIITPAGSIGYSDVDDVYGLMVEIWFADDDTPTNPAKMATMQYGTGATDVFGMSIMPNDSSSFKLQTGKDGVLYMTEAGNRVALGGASTGAYRVIITKPNLVTTYADTSFRKVYDIADGVDITHTLPDATNFFTEQIIKRKGTGTGNVIIKNQSAVTLATLTEEEVTIVFFPNAGIWEIKDKFVEAGEELSFETSGSIIFPDWSARRISDDIIICSVVWPEIPKQGTGLVLTIGTTLFTADGSGVQRQITGAHSISNFAINDKHIEFRINEVGAFTTLNAGNLSMLVTGAGCNLTIT